jgi:hypothetical protein
MESELHVLLLIAGCSRIADVAEITRTAVGSQGSIRPQRNQVQFHPSTIYGV